jgi:predicted NAD/FAD-dependent oxidoreductase
MSARRIGIVGAGVSGLTAAHHLQRHGYRDVTVLEREGRVGGKCATIERDGRTYELGAVFGARSYGETLRLMHEVGVRGGPFGSMSTYDLDGHPRPSITSATLPTLLRAALVTYPLLTDLRYRAIHRPGLAGVDRDLAEPFAPFARRHGLPTLARVVAQPFTAFGYGYFDEVPTAYVMKYIDMPMLESLGLSSRRLVWPEGVQALWERVAASHDVRLGAGVRQVTRGSTIGVRTEAGEFEFDSLILTAPLDEALEYLDPSPVERELFGRIRCFDYWVLLCEVAGLPEESGFLPEHFTAADAGHALAWYHRWAGDPLYTFYVLGGPGWDAEGVRRTCIRDVERLGGTVGEIVAQKRWRYFPHVGPAELAGGFYDELEGLQGVRGTYYAGEVMQFATIEECARYSRSLVERHFA